MLLDEITSSIFVYATHDTRKLSMYVESFIFTIEISGRYSK